MIKDFKKSTKRLYALAAACLIISGGASLIGAKVYASTTSIESKIQDKIDYPFLNDSEAVGKWETVDFVKEIDDFKPGEKQWKGGDYLKSITIIQDGKMAQPDVQGMPSDEKTLASWLTWTKGYIISSADKTASQYTIKEINGTKYMFMEWKSGDYTLRGMKPWYYVLKASK
ncbi:hypothetical protein psyc5s11_06960 [Clostridium gelidum]|uniref:Uncharacterized protein n=1 Tax=Clostridium gelidum TaxID=704125 RepID=A0ABM7SYG1_9CLOT|nr:hypothetical protein [Clostridium gelidum]BCZ44629.1 hypothetical protein psyc5s11_06960 [Clostridium gelidum]